RLEPGGQPKELVEWLKKKKTIMSPPKIEKPSDFGLQWRTYYRSLQPFKRLAGEELLQVECTMDEWRKLMKGTKNGFFLLIVTLCWW
ncbi:hypothetical protein BD410DRAFT_695221, partial [Rickenella mellea]